MNAVDISAASQPRVRRCRIAMMGSGNQSGIFSGGSRESKERQPVLPWVIAGIVVLLVLGVFLIPKPHQGDYNPGGANLAPADPYAEYLPLSGIHMSESSSVAGSKLTYVDGVITNRGTRTVSDIRIQVAFHDFTNQIAQKATMPLTLIRTHEPYIDTEPVSAAPIKPGESREFRLIFDHVPDGWNQQYPELRIIEVTGN